MKRSKFTEAQIAFILRQAEEGTAVGEVCRKAVYVGLHAPASYETMVNKSLMVAVGVPEANPTFISGRGTRHAYIFGANKTRQKIDKRWSRVSEQILRVDKWSVCQG